METLKYLESFCLQTHLLLFCLPNQVTWSSAESEWAGLQNGRGAGVIQVSSWSMSTVGLPQPLFPGSAALLPLCAPTTVGLRVGCVSGSFKPTCQRDSELSPHLDPARGDSWISPASLSLPFRGR